MNTRRYDPPQRPLLIADVRDGEAGVILSGGQFAITSNSFSTAELARILRRFDGQTSIEEILESESRLSRPDVSALVESLDHAGLIDDALPALGRHGSEVILEIEELVEEYCETTIYENDFWRLCLKASAPGDLPQRLATGMVIENWHFLFRESYFDAPVLSYVPNTQVRLLLNQFFSEEYGHDEILLKSLNSVGISREDMADAIPLPETMGLCNALSYWAHNDPLFFFTTLGLLEGQGMKKDSFIEACERCGLPEDFVTPLRTHADINIGAAHGNLTRAIFKEISSLDDETVARLKRQIPLFVELYDNFYTGVFRYYTSEAPLLRRVSEL
jgi:hypothetical protein